MLPVPKTSIYGPYELTSFQGQLTTPFLTVPFTESWNTAILVTVSDNAGEVIQAINQPDAAAAYSLITVKMELLGSIQGYNTILKRDTLRVSWGPLVYYTDPSDAYDNLIFAARVFIGGAPKVPADLVYGDGTAGLPQLEVKADIKMVMR